MTWDGASHAEARRQWAEIEAAEIAAETYEAEHSEYLDWLDAVARSEPPEVE